MNINLTEAHLYPVAAVCGKEVTLYGPVDPKTGVRARIGKQIFPHHGAAVLWAQEYDARQNMSARRH